MVFESLVTDLVNRFLGDYIENLDKSQLKIGIWGGDVVLKDLFIKDSALDDLDLPVKIVHGNIGNLTLKVPWKNLYTEPVVANLQGLYLVACPNLGVKYNAEKEEKNAQERKQKELEKMEEAKKLQAQKNKPQDKKADSFAEKMATQVIKNLQVNVSDIHIRYEDKFSNPSSPISIGVTLKGLSFQTTDENWKPTIIKDTVSMIYKMVTLDSLAVYWNSKSDMLIGASKEVIYTELRENIASKTHSTRCQYLIKPISSTAQLRLNTHPENTDFSMPKVLLNVLFQEIAIALTKKQYQDVMELLQAFERVNTAGMYRKYRPDVGHKGHSKQWWHFGYNCILEEVVRRRRKMWSWENISNHRQLCKKYKEAWKKKLVNQKVPKDVQETIDFCERQLNVFNITLARNQAEMENKKAGVKKAKDSGGGGWFGGWFGGGKKKKVPTATLR